MATTALSPLKAPYRGAIFNSWLAIPNGNQGAALSVGLFRHTVQITGTLGAGGSLQWEGSLDGGTTWGLLHSISGASSAMTALGCLQLAECPPLIRPNVTAGDGTTSLNAYLLSAFGFI